MKKLYKKPSSLCVVIESTYLMVGSININGDGGTGTIDNESESMTGGRTREMGSPIWDARTDEE